MMIDGGLLSFYQPVTLISPWAASQPRYGRLFKWLIKCINTTLPGGPGSLRVDLYGCFQFGLPQELDGLFYGKSNENG